MFISIKHYSLIIKSSISPHMAEAMARAARAVVAARALAPQVMDILPSDKSNVVSHYIVAAQYESKVLASTEVSVAVRV